MKLSNQSEVPVYTISGSNTARPLPEWLARRRKRSLKDDPEYANRVELLQDFEFEEASQCIRVSEDGQWVMSTGRIFLFTILAEIFTNGHLQVHTNHRFTRIIYLNYHSPGHGTQSLLTQHSYFYRPITQNPSISSLTAPLNSTHPPDATTQLVFLDMDVT